MKRNTASERSDRRDGVPTIEKPGLTSSANPHLLTVEEAAIYMRVSRQTAYDEVAEGKWPIIHVRRRIFVVRKLLDEMIDNEARENWRRTN
jgi:excisionase family DNA binding protein